MSYKRMKIFIKGSILLAALLLFAGHLAHSSTARATLQEKHDSESISPEQLAQAKATFSERCARCHGADGRGQTILGGMLGVPNFTDEKWWKEEKSDKHLINSVTEGKDEMPAFGKKLSKQEITALVFYVRRFNKAIH
jgi:mono/diheme cytochrome c family protein